MRRTSRGEFAEILYYWATKDLHEEKVNESARDLGFEIKSDEDLDKIFRELLILNMYLTVMTAEMVFADEDKRNDYLDLLHHLIYDRHFAVTELDFHDWMRLMGTRYLEYQKAGESQHPPGPIWELAKAFNRNLFGEVRESAIIQWKIGEHIGLFLEHLRELILQYEVE